MSNENESQNLNIQIDDLLKHLNFIEFFFEMELVKNKNKNFINFFIKKIKFLSHQIQNKA